jgi:predicted metal-dependent phosphotriesterase family hydrolase
MENFIYEMLKLGIDEADIKMMTRDNPAKMIGIEL